MMLVAVAAVGAMGQARAAAGVKAADESRFPGISASQMTTLRAAKRVTPVPLPTWLPEGFAVERIESKLGAKVPLWERALVIVYSRKIAGGKLQRFAIEAGFEGIGDLPYEETSSVRSSVGTIYIAYQPKDEDGKPIRDFSMTHWFEVGKTPFHYDGMRGYKEGDKTQVMIPLADTKKILASLQRF